jgi:hypothetical protein
MMLLRLLALLVLWSSPPLKVGICALVPPGDADEQTNTATNRVLGGCDADGIFPIPFLSRIRQRTDTAESAPHKWTVNLGNQFAVMAPTLRSLQQNPSASRDLI